MPVSVKVSLEILVRYTRNGRRRASTQNLISSYGDFVSQADLSWNYRNSTVVQCSTGIPVFLKLGATKVKVAKGNTSPLGVHAEKAKKRSSLLASRTMVVPTSTQLEVTFRGLCVEARLVGSLNSDAAAAAVHGRAGTVYVEIL
ncbi:hypothetical protein R3P38DRAFT_3373009 [Favolaschia claudopus]|uniref:Uncharacterized protein n=1 Tax=Favolaschia claudopus TaxID=2862362 RepID=A0AAV9ZUR2_9AGAR